MGSAEEAGPNLSAVIVTYRREQVLVETIDALLALADPPDELIVVDETPRHGEEVERRLERLHGEGKIRRLRLPKPSITAAMNRGLCEARHEIVLYLDDDILPEEGLVTAHRRAHEETEAALVAGRVVQPWEKGREHDESQGFAFTSRRTHWIEEFMGGNFSVKRTFALDIGGFDENFVKVAYRYEREFADRVIEAGGRIRYEPGASIEHLQSRQGGNRAYGRTWYHPGHGVGEYYYLLRSPRAKSRAGRMTGRILGSVVSRYHLTHPWIIPVTLLSETAAIFWALKLRVGPPRYADCGEGSS